MNDTQKTRVFVDLYTSALQSACNNPYLRSPAEGTDKWKQLEAARKIVEEMGGEYADFIRCQFTGLARLGVICSPSHMCSKKAIERYQIHQKLKNKYHHKSYSVDGNEFVVNATGMRYPISQADAPLSGDATATYAHWLAKEGELPANKVEAIIALEYAVAKLRYKDKVPTDSMVRMLRKCKENP